MFGTNAVPLSGAVDAFIVSYDPAGDVNWVNGVGGSGHDEFESVALGPDGGLYTVGLFNSTNLMAGMSALPNAGGDDVLAAKFLPSGSLQWAVGLGGSGMDHGLGVAVNESGIVGIGGYFNSPNFVFSTNDTLATLGGSDGFVGGLNSNGVPQGAVQIGGTGNEGVQGVAVDRAGDFLGAGFIGSSSVSFGNLRVGTFSPGDAFVAKLSGNGGPTWIRSLGGSGADEAADIATGHGQEILLIGETASPTMTFGANTIANNGNVDIFIAGLTNDSFYLETHPVSVQTNSGGSASFSVAVVGPGALGYQWRHNGRHLAGETAAAFALESVVPANSGAYDVVVTSGTNTLTSRPAQLTVDGQVLFGGVNLAQGVASFADRVVVRGNGTVRPSATYDDPNQVIGFSDEGAPGVQHMSLGRGGSVTVQFTDNVLTGSGDSSTDLWIYEVGPLVERMLVEVSKDGTNFLSVGAVSGQPGGIDLDAFGFGFNDQFFFVRVTDDPNSGSHGSPTPGADVDAIAAVTSVAPDPLIVTHPTNQTVVAGNNVMLSVAAAGTAPIGYQWFKNGGPVVNETNRTLQLTSVTAGDAGTYHVAVSNALGTVQSRTAVLTVQVPPFITSLPLPTNAVIGGQLMLTVGAAGTSPLQFQWRRDGSPLSGQTNATLALNNVTLADAGQYTVEVTNIAGQVTSDAVPVSVLVPPVITTQPQSRSVGVGANVDFSVTANGSSPLHSQWFKDGTPIAGATNLVLSLTNVIFGDSGTYRMGINNFAGATQSSNANLLVVAFPVFGEQPQSRIAREGASVAFRVSVTNASHLQWQRNGVNLPGETNRVLTLTRVQPSSAGNYSVRAFNATTNVSSATAVLTVSGASIISEVGNWPDVPRGEVFDVFYTNGYVYAASGPAGLRIYNLTNGNSLVLLGSVDTEGSATAVHVRGSTAYVADGDAGLAVIDVTDPFHPELRGSLDTPDFAQDVFLAGNHAYVADMEAGVQVIDISSPNSPSLTATYNTPARAEGVFVGAGNRLYVADMLAGVHIADVSNPVSPVLLGTFDTDGAARSVEVVGNTAYVADWTAGVSILNVANPTNVTQLGGLALPNEAYDIRVSGTNAYVADFSSGLRVLNLSNPSAPSLMGTYNTTGFAIGVASGPGMAFVADWTGGLQVIDVSQPTPMLITGITAQGSSWDVTVEGQHAFVADFDAGLQIIDVSDPTGPVMIGQLDTAGVSVGVDVDNQWAYVADYDRGLLIVDVSDPRAPIQRGNFNTDGFARDVEVINRLAYVADDHAGLQIIDVSVPNAPARVGELDTLDQAFAVQVVNQIAYIADLRGGLQIISVANPAAPVLLGGTRNANTGEAWDVAVAGNIAYVAEGKAGLKVYNVSNPASPVLIGNFDTTGDAVSVGVSGNVAAVADWTGGVIYLDVSNPQSPAHIAAFNNEKLAGSIGLTGDYAFVGSRAQGLSIVNVPGAGGFAPLITQQPVDQGAFENASTLFVATATGSPVLRYQWQKDGVNVVGATNRGLVLSNLQISDSGSYRLSVSNSFGSVLSVAANLVVTQGFQEDSVIFVQGGSQIVGGVMRLEFSRVAGTGPTTGYRVQASHDLINWVTLTDSPTSANGVLRVNDPSAGGQHCRFYRVVREEQ
ncbi:MAG: immunoglobulin domain-containing protein [Limisphaerales bacterium]